MDKAVLNKKSVEQLKTLAKKLGAKTETPDGKQKNKTQLVNGILMKYRLNGNKSAGSKARGMASGAKAKVGGGKYAVSVAVASNRAALIYQRKGQKTKLQTGTTAGIAKLVQQLQKDGLKKVSYRDIKL